MSALAAGRAVALAATLAACGPTPPPALVPAESHDLTAEPVRPSSAHYPSPAIPAPTDPVVEAVAALAERAARGLRQPAPVLDGPLSAAAATIAAGPPGAPSGASLAFAQSHHGLLAPIAVGLEITGPADAEPTAAVARLLPALVEGLKRTGANRLGVATTAGDPRRIVVLLQTRLAVLEGLFPRSMALGDGAALTGQVLAPLRLPSVHLTNAQGEASQVPAAVTGQRFEAQVRCGAPGRHQVEIMAQGEAGPAVAANFPVWCGVSPPTAPPTERVGPREQAAARVGQRLLALANDARRAAGRGPLEWDERLAGVAQRHSADMARHGYIGHRSPRSGHPGDRVRAAGVRAAAVLENVGLGPDAEALHAGFMRSPAHRAALLSPTAERMGAAAVATQGGVGHGQLYATQVFIEPLKALDADVGLGRLRKAAKARGWRREPVLDEIAAAAAARYSKGLVTAQEVNGYAVLRYRAQLELRLKSMQTLVGVGQAPERVLGQVTGTRCGLAVVAGQDAEGLPVYYTVALVGE